MIHRQLPDRTLRPAPGPGVAAGLPKGLPPAVRTHRPAQARGPASEREEARARRRGRLAPMLQSGIATVIGCGIIVGAMYAYGWTTGYFEQTKPGIVPPPPPEAFPVEVDPPEPKRGPHLKGMRYHFRRIRDAKAVEAVSVSGAELRRILVPGAADS